MLLDFFQFDMENILSMHIFFFSLLLKSCIGLEVSAISWVEVGLNVRQVTSMVQCVRVCVWRWQYISPYIWDLKNSLKIGTYP